MRVEDGRVCSEFSRGTGIGSPDISRDISGAVTTLQAEYVDGKVHGHYVCYGRAGDVRGEEDYLRGKWH